MSIRRLTVALAVAVAAVGATAASADAWTLSGSGGSLTAAPTTEPEFAISVTIGTDGKVHFTPAAGTLPAACSNSGGATVCPTSALATELEIDSALGTYVDGVTTKTLRIVGTSGSDQWTLSNVTINGLLDIDPGGGGNDQLNATGTVASMQLDNTVGDPGKDTGTIAMTLDTGATTGTIQLPTGNNNYVYAPDSALSVTGAGNLTAGGTLTGGSGHSTFHAVSTSQNIIGSGQDAVTFARITTPLTLTMDGSNVLLTGDTSPHVLGVDDVTAGSGSDTLIGGPPPTGEGPLTLRGGAGNDLFVPMGEPETIIGAPGNTMNTVSYAYLPDSTPLTVDLSAGLGGPTGDPQSQLDQLTNIEGVIGNNGTDTITGGSRGGTFALGNGTNTVTGGPENDTIQAGSGTDNINGGGGNDTIMGGSGSDTLIGGPGNNKIQAGSGPTVLEDSGGDNTLVGGGGDDTVSYANRTAQQGVNVTLNGTAGSTGNGQPGENDTISGIENIIGGAGDDVLIGDGNANVIQAGSGLAVIKGGDGNDTLTGGSGNDTITAGRGVNTITTGNGGNLVNAVSSAKGSSVNCGSGFNDVTVNPSVQANGCQIVFDPFIKPVQIPPTLINATLVPSTKALSGGYTRFKKLDILNVPSQTSVAVTCSATLLSACPTRNNPESLNFNSAKSKVHLLPFLKPLKFPNGSAAPYEVAAKTTLTIAITGGANSIGRLFKIVTRKGGAPSIKSSCLKPPTQLSQSATSNTAGFTTKGGGFKTIKCPAPSMSKALETTIRRRAAAVRLHPETQQQRQRAVAEFATASAQIRALVQRDAAALALAK